jgi:RNA-directed DNA polymerase
MLKTIQAWLESGITIGNVWFQTIEGTPQGSVLSPLLCNIAMHGLEKELGVRIINDKGHLDTKGRLLVRYADDFTVFCRNKSDSEAASEQLSKSLKERGLELNLLKTKISHAAEGFDFLGFNIRYRPKYGADPTRAIIPLPEGDYYVDYNLASIYIHPSEKSIKKVMDSIKNIFLNHQGKPAKELINKTNPIIRGWAESKRHWHCTSTFRKLDHYLYNLQWRWMRRQHPNKSVGWLKKRYFTTLILGPINNNWVFADPLNRKVVMHQFKWYPQYNHVMIRNLAVPDDPNLTEYFEELEITRAELKPPSLFSTFENNLFISQDGICPICENSLSNGESLHKHHIIPKSQEGKDTFTNILILHLACHYQIHSRYENFYQSLVDFKADHPCVYSNEQRKKMREARRKARLRKKGNNTL